jgi:hypothetical protein
MSTPADERGLEQLATDTVILHAAPPNQPPGGAEIENGHPAMGKIRSASFGFTFVCRFESHILRQHRA